MGALKENYDAHLRAEQEKELEQIQKLRDKIERYTWKSKVKQVEAEEEVKEQ